MSSDFGQNLHLSLFGESHGAAVGMVLQGLPAGETIDQEELAAFLARRSPGRFPWCSGRQEPDQPRFLSGLLQNCTCGTPLCGIIDNLDAQSADYQSLAQRPRPGHGDYPVFVKYHGFTPQAGGGHFSGRLTAPLCLAGGICRQILARRGVEIAAHLAAVGGIADRPFDPLGISEAAAAQIAARPLPVQEQAAGEQMAEAIMAAKAAGDSLGGIIEGMIQGLPAGLGDPLFDGVENRLAAALFAIPAVTGVEFGTGFGAADRKGSQNNDPYSFDPAGQVRTDTNHHGGALAGITTGMPVLLRVAIKPTPTIGKSQATVDLATGQPCQIQATGRHDPCIAPRAVAAVEAVCALVALDLYLGQR